MKLFATCLLAAFAVTGIVSATPITTVTAELLAAGPTDPNLKDSQGYLVGPYTLSVNGKSYLTMCVDVDDWSYVGTSYSAYETPLSGGNLSDTYHPGDSVQYAEEAYLLTLLLKPGSDRTDIQDAAWSITDSSFKIGSAAQAYVKQAVANYASLNLSGFDLISGVNQGTGRSQEFLIDPGPAAVATPEPATVFLLGGGLALAGLVGRRKMVKA